MRLLYALRFLTIIPFPHRKDESIEDIACSTLYYPLVGLLIGGLLYGAALGLSYLLAPYPGASLILSLWILITGGLHLDGLSDLADGMGGGKNREERLAIMKDSRVGAFGVISLIIVLLVKWSMIGGLLSGPSVGIVLVAPTAARTVVLILIRVFPVARADGMGAFFKRYSSLREPLVGIFFTFGVAWLFSGIAGIMVVIVSLILVVFFGLIVSRSLRGLTGDVYGAAIEITEVLILTFALLVQGMV